MSILTFLCARLCPPPCIDGTIERPFKTLRVRSSKHIRDVLSAAFPAASIRLADREYSAPSIGDFNRWIKEDCVSERKYFVEHFDCDNFSRLLRCKMFNIGRNYETEITMAYCEGVALGGYHAFCVFIDNADNVYIVEPQTDASIIYNESEYNPDFIQM